LSITVARAQRHISEHGQRLSGARQQALWPSHLFHTTHVVNAVNIVVSGFIGARNQVDKFHDVANQGALGAFEGSHDYARLYFRPKNGFHLRTEGIKCLCDSYRLANQMSIPVCFVFRLVDVLTRADACFSTGNVQRSSHYFQTGDYAFDELDFQAIYHDSPTDQANGDYIRNCRMAEVAVKERLSLSDGLHAILFRTKWDLETFLYMLSLRRIACTHRLSIEQVAGSIFMSQGMYITDLSFRDDELKMSFHFPLRNAPLDKHYEVGARQECEMGVLLFDKKLLLDKPTLAIVKYYQEPSSIWTIHLEQELAFQGALQHAQSELFT
jgi:hypothetical protein